MCDSSDKASDCCVSAGMVVPHTSAGQNSATHTVAENRFTVPSPQCEYYYLRGPISYPMDLNIP